VKQKFDRTQALNSVKIIMTLAWPTIMEHVMQTAVQYIDTAMVGALGTQATAAVGATGTVGWLVNGTVSACGVGFLAAIAKACGAGDRRRAREIVAQAVIAVLAVGSLFTVLPLLLAGQVPVWMQVDSGIRHEASVYFFILYSPMLARTASTIFGTALRAAGDTKTPMKVGVLVNIVNVVLNFLLIYETRQISIFGLSFTMPGAGLGTTGAAIASAAAFLWGGIHITAVLWNHPEISPRGIKLRPDMEILRPCMKIALPNMLQRFGTSLGYVFFASMINSLGDISTAAHTIANTVESAFYIPGYGMQTAAATLTGNAYGARDNERMRRLTNMFIPIEIFLMTLTGAALFIFAPSLMGIFSRSQTVIDLGTTVLRMVAVSEPMYGFSVIVEGMMMGVGRTRRPFLYNIVGMWGVRIVGTFVCTQLLNLDLVSAWGCMIAHNALLFVCYLVAFVRGSWNPLNEKTEKKPAVR